MSNASVTIRRNAIVAAIGHLDPENSFTKDGLPEVKAIEEILGFDIKAGERDAAWADLQEKKDGASGVAVTIDNLLPGMREKGIKV